MPIIDYIKDRRNKIVIGGLSGVGLIVTTTAALFPWVKPAYLIQNPDGESLFQVSDHGAIGVGSGADAFGDAGDCLKSGGNSGAMMSFGDCGTGGTSGGGNWSGTGALQTAFDNRYVNTSGDTMTGALRVQASISGASLRIDNLKSCDTIDTDPNGVLSCGTDDGGVASVNEVGTSSFSGGVLRLGDSRYVNTSGDTMTGSLNILNNSSLQVAGTITGSIIKAVTSLSSSGTLVFEGAASGSSLYLGTSLTGAGLSDCDTAGTSKLLWDVSTGRFTCGTDTDTNTTYTFGQGLTTNGTLITLTPFHSGSTIWATTALRSSGSLVWEGVASGATLYVGGSLQGVGLEDCDLATQTLNWDVTTGRFSCGTDADTNTTYTAGEGLDLTSTSFSLSDSISGTLLEFQTVSGSRVHANSLLTTSGSLAIEGSASGEFGLTMRLNDSGGEFLRFLQSDGQNSILMETFGADNGRLTIYDASGNTDIALSGGANASYFRSGDVGIGTNNPDVPGVGLEIIGIGSGITLQASSMLASSGGLVVEGTASGSLFRGTTMSGTFVRAREFWPRQVAFYIFGSGSTVATGSGKSMLTIGDISLSGSYIKSAHLSVGTAGTTNTTTLQLRNANKNSCKVFSTPVSIDSTEVGSDTAATPYVINTSCRSVGAYHRFFADIPSVSTTVPKGDMILWLVLDKL